MQQQNHTQDLWQKVSEDAGDWIWDEVSNIENSENVLDTFEDDYRRCGYPENYKLVKLLCLAAMTRHFNHPVSLCSAPECAPQLSRVARRALQFQPAHSYGEFTFFDIDSDNFDNCQLSHRIMLLDRHCEIINGSISAALSKINSQLNFGELASECVDGRWRKLALNRGPAVQIIARKDLELLEISDEYFIFWTATKVLDLSEK